MWLVEYWLANWQWWYMTCVLGMAYLSWYPYCCCDPLGPPPCNKCTADVDAISLTIDGFGSDTNCIRCEYLNGTYVVYRTQQNTCSWQLDQYFGCTGLYTDALLKLRASATVITPGTDTGWYVTISLLRSPSWNTDATTYRWASGSSDPFDCTATQSLAHFFTIELQDLCTGWTALTVSVN